MSKEDQLVSGTKAYRAVKAARVEEWKTAIGVPLPQILMPTRTTPLEERPTIAAHALKLSPQTRKI